MNVNNYYEVFFKKKKKLLLLLLFLLLLLSLFQIGIKWLRPTNKNQPPSRCKYSFHAVLDA